MNEQEKEMLINCGALGYSHERVASLFGWDEIKTQKELADQNSEKAKMYKIGEVQAEYVIDLKIFELAKGGDLKALELYEKSKQKRKLKNG